MIMSRVVMLSVIIYGWCCMVWVRCENILGGVS